MIKSAEPFVLSPRARVVACAALASILFVSPHQAAGQNSQPEENQTENVQPLFSYDMAGPPGLLVKQRVNPVYPPLAKQAGIQGSVRLRVTINKDGSVMDIWVLSGPPQLVGAALDALQQWRYSPNKVVRVTVVTVNFRLDKAGPAAPPAQATTAPAVPIQAAEKPPAPASPEPAAPGVDVTAVKNKISLGDFHYRRGEYDGAIAAYREGLAMDPSNVELRWKLQETIDTCKKENALLGEHANCGGRNPLPWPGPNPTSLLSPVTMGDFFYKRGQYVDAISAYAEGLRLDPSNAELRQKHNQTIHACEAILGEHLNCGTPIPLAIPSPASPEPAAPGVDVTAVKNKINLGDFHYRRGEYDDAISAYREGLALDPSNVELRGILQETINACKKKNALLNEDLRCEGH